MENFCTTDMLDISYSASHMYDDKVFVKYVSLYECVALWTIKCIVWVHKIKSIFPVRYVLCVYVDNIRGQMWGLLRICKFWKCISIGGGISNWSTSSVLNIFKHSNIYKSIWYCDWVVRHQFRKYLPVRVRVRSDKL